MTTPQYNGAVTVHNRCYMVVSYGINKTRCLASKQVLVHSVGPPGLRGHAATPPAPGSLQKELNLESAILEGTKLGARSRGQEVRSWGLKDEQFELL